MRNVVYGSPISLDTGEVVTNAVRKEGTKTMDVDTVKKALQAIEDGDDAAARALLKEILAQAAGGSDDGSGEPPKPDEAPELEADHPKVVKHRADCAAALRAGDGITLAALVRNAPRVRRPTAPTAPKGPTVTAGVDPAAVAAGKRALGWK